MRHAQEYWLKLQAEKAVKKAMAGEMVPVHIQYMERHPLQTLIDEREVSLSNAANSLTFAEILHREIVRRGGQV